MKIDSADISCVVQGAVIPHITEKCIKSIRKALPKCQIILSTWKNTEQAFLKKLDYDVLVLSEDPGSSGVHYYKKKSVPYNFNRQLVSTVQGLKKASKKYAFKIRSDFYLKNANFLRFFDSFPLQDEKFTFFRHRVVVPSLYSRQYSEQTGFPLPFHPSDLFLFGLTADLKDYFFSCHQIDKTEGSLWKYKTPDRKPYISETGRFTAEQTLCLAWLGAHGVAPEFYDFSDWSEELLEFSNNVLFNNFIFAEPFSLGLRSKKFFKEFVHAFFFPWYGLITYKKLCEEYKKRF